MYFGNLKKIMKKILIFLATQICFISFCQMFSIATGIPLTLFSALYMFFPFFGVMIAETMCKSFINWSSLKFRINRYFFLSILIPVIMTLLSIAFSLIFVKDTSLSLSFEGLEKLGGHGSSEPFSIFRFSALLLKALVFGITVNAFFALAEEFAWRDFLIFELNRKTGLFVAMLADGLIWGLWHIPLILDGANYPGFPFPGSVLMILFCLLSTPLLVFLRIRSNSVIPCAVFHGLVNSFSSISVGIIKGGSVLSTGNLGLSGIIGLAVIDACLFIIYHYKKSSNPKSKS